MGASILNRFLEFCIGYFLSVNVISGVLLLAALWRLWIRKIMHPMFQGRWASLFSLELPSISIIAPAYNEEKTIIASVRSLLSLDYPNFEVIVVNDGSKDKTLETMIQAFSMELIRDSLMVNKLSTSRVYGVYRSRINPMLTLIDKQQGGKADALNIGIGFSRCDLFCAVDADSLLEPDALLRIVTPFVEHPETAIASGGSVRVVNGSEIRNNRVQNVRLPLNLICLFQIVEYTRAFLFGRAGWRQLNSTLIISGAFGLFKKQPVIDVGGYSRHSIGEDMELVVRLNEKFQKSGIPYLIEFTPDAICWTEVPSDLQTLFRQRHRWQRGLADSLRRQKQMFLNPRYGIVGMIGVPYFVVVELLGPFVEVAAYVVLLASFCFGTLSVEIALLFLSFGIMTGVITSVAAVFIEKHYFSKRPRIRDLTVLALVAFLENFGYRQILSIWRLMGLLSYFRGNHHWGDMQRTGFSDSAPIAIQSFLSVVDNDGDELRVVSQPHTLNDQGPEI